MHEELQYLVHFFHEKQYLFKTISMADPAQVEAICDAVAAQRGWFWPRFAPSERRDYMVRRRFVEEQLYADYTRAYGSLKERIPVYFYLYPNMTPERAVELARRRAQSGEQQPHVLMARTADIAAADNITFTLHDSMRAYWKRSIENGIPCRGDPPAQVVLPDHNRVFPFSMIEQIHRRYQTGQIQYEVQVWDYHLLEQLPYTVL